MRSPSFIRLLGFLLVCSNLAKNATAQSQTSYPYASETVKVDLNSPKADKVPFDKPFILVIDNINTETFIRAYMYRVKAKAGDRNLWPDKEYDSYADYVFSTSEVISEKTKLTLIVPALRPSMDFDILVERKLSGRNLDKAHTLDILMMDAIDKNPGVDPSTEGFSWPTQVSKAYVTLRDSANNNSFKIPRDVFTILSVTDYYTNIFKKYEAEFRAALADVNYKVSGGVFVYMDDPQIKAIATGGPGNAKPFKDANHVEQVQKEGTFDEILLGLRPMGYSYGSKLTDKNEFDKRIANFNASISFFDTLYRSLNEMAGKDANFDGCRDKVQGILNVLQANKKVLADYLKAINKIRSSYNEGVWLVGTTQAKDLQTKSTSIFTLDAGFTNISARDLNNRIVYIPKLYWGVNIYFRGTDKNLRSRYIPKKRNAGSVTSLGEPIYCDYDILTRKSIFSHLCMTIGFSFGSLDKQNFDNFFAGSSMMVGPSLRLTRSFRLSAGAAFLKRTNKNPVLTDKEVTVGGYLSASLDFDILNAIKSVAIKFF